MSMLLRTRRVFRSACVAFLLILMAFGPWNCRAQTQAPSSTLEGMVVDPSGARVPHALIQIHPDDPSLHIKPLKSDSLGHFAAALPHGTYTVTVEFPGFEPFHATLTVPANGSAHLDVALAIPALVEEVIVDPDGGGSPTGENKGAFVLSGKDLNMFSRDNATFEKEIEAMAGGDPKHPNVYVNGFSGGRFPAKNTIASIRLNRNPYSVFFDQYGIGRIEIFTKPGTDKLHGELDSTGNDISFNAPNPYIGAQPPYYSFTEDANLTGPLGTKTSFFLAGTYNDQQSNAAVHAFTLDPANNFQPIQLTQAVPDPVKSSTFSLRLDRQVTPNNTFTGSYQFNRLTTHNGSVGLLTLAEQGFNSGQTTQILQLSDSQMIGAKMVAETRFQYVRTRLGQDPVSTAPSILVEGAFNGGGNPTQQLHDNQDFYEFQQYLSRQQGSHFLRIGGRYRLYRDANLSRANYNGQFYFPSLTSYQITQQVSNDPNNIGLSASALDALIRSTCDPQPNGPPICGGATQYSITTGQSTANVLTGDLAIFAEDEWKYNKFLTLDLGFRFESQSAVPDHIDPAPRLGVAWSIYRKKSKAPFVILRGGAGVFYDRFQAANLLTAIRQNGVTQQTFLAQNPFYPAPSLTAVPATPYTLDPHLKTEYGIFTGGGAEHTFGKLGRSAITFTDIRGDHQYLSRNINAPLPGTYDPANPASGVRPLGGNQNIYQFDSSGIFNAQEILVTSRLNFSKPVTAFVIYKADRTRSDANTASSFVSNSYDVRADYGAAARITQSLTVGSSAQLPFGLSANMFLGITSGVPFNITTGTDLNGDTIYNDRPAFATDLARPSVVKTRFGNFDTAPIAGQKIIPINYGNAPGSIMLEPSLGRNFAFGPRPAAAAATPGAKPGPRPDPPFTLTLSIEAYNVLNHVNPGAPIGVLTSPFFGKSISLGDSNTVTAANRVIQLHMNFSF